MDEKCKSCFRDAPHLPDGHYGYRVIARFADDKTFCADKEHLAGKACARCWMPVAAAEYMHKIDTDYGLGSHYPTEYLELEYVKGVLLAARIDSLERLVEDQAQQLRSALRK
tara:strand:+ start:599 stop:934 length:336 start_codon:yes stop_codon:yes gene_type:complete